MLILKAGYLICMQWTEAIGRKWRLGVEVEVLLLGKDDMRGKIILGRLWKYAFEWVVGGDDREQAQRLHHTGVKVILVQTDIVDDWTKRECGAHEKCIVDD